MKFSPQTLVKYGLFSIVVILAMMLAVLSLQINQSKLEYLKKLNIISTMMSANQLHQHYAYGSPAKFNNEQFKLLAGSQVNSNLKFKLSLGNQDKLLSINEIEKEINKNGAVNSPYLVEWLSSIELEAFIDTFTIDAKSEAMMAPVLVFTNPIWLCSIGFLVISALIIGYGFGRMRVFAPSYSVAAMTYKARPNELT